MSTLKIVLLTLAVVTVTSCAISDRHDNSDGYQGKFSKVMSYKLSRKLDLTDPQKDNLNALVAQVRESHDTMNTDGSDHKQALKALLREASLDQQKLQQMLNHKADAIKVESPVVIQAFATFTNSLDQNQREKLVDMMDHRSHRSSHWGWK